jgi:uncharacterized membrane protein
MGARDSVANSIQMEHFVGRPLLVSAGAADNYVKFHSAQSVLLFLNITLLACNGMISSL